MTQIPGKDSPLDASIHRLKDALRRLGFELEESRWQNPAPNVWSVRLRDRHCPAFSSRGKGSSRDAALASALGEFFERISCNQFFANFHFGNRYANAEFAHYPEERWFPFNGGTLPEGLLDGPSLQHINMDDLLTPRQLVDLNTDNPARGICALPFTRQKTGERVWFPVNVISNLYSRNGLATGNNQWEARVAALSEIFERHIKTTILSAGITLPRIPDEVIARYPQVVQALDTLRQHGLVPLINDASLGGKFPLVNLTVLNPADGGCIASFGAHPKFEVALERTLTNLLQYRTLDQLHGFQPPTFDLGEVADPANLTRHFSDSTGAVAWDLIGNAPDYRFTEWNTEGDSRAEFDHLCYLIHKVDMDIYIADYQHLGIYSCRIIVPGMSEIQPVDTLQLNNSNAGQTVRDACLQLGSLSPKACTELFEQLDEAGYDDQQPVAQLIGILADPGSSFESLRVGELKCLLALARGELESAREWSDWTLQQGQLSGERAELHRCLNQCLKFTLDESRPLEQYQPVLEQLYGEPLLSRCRAMLTGEQLFTDLPSDDGDLRQFGQHSRLLQAYGRLHKIRRDNL
ncbi:30S ribosomal protein S12 methylthiotransferase accessory factor YcaO [Marinobacterium arenosum]|uniref:30S ribosomal protein S12 methylthiotransferase accessory factor YcaO n=1 Tax=Marinobacterium arenosum TaxID=2862496 RepID=UPI001C95A7A8|nr:30S ribosomal protein S12 methylthiotransferase accessory factor YcaO [Marinobacterium arenosum]MBY4678670.1 YcaO-like family protein [Marinobacterium arenosum]